MRCVDVIYDKVLRMDGPTDGWTDRPSYRDAFLTDASKNAGKYIFTETDRQTVRQIETDKQTQTVSETQTKRKPSNHLHKAA